MRKEDGSDFNTVPPPAGGDVYAAETIIGKAPAEILAELRGPGAEDALGPDDVETIVLAPASTTRPISHRSEASQGSEVSERDDGFQGSEVSQGSEHANWVFPVVVTVLICALMFLLGRLL